MAERVGFEPYGRGRYPIEPQLASLISKSEYRGKTPRASVQRLESGGASYFFSRMTASIVKGGVKLDHWGGGKLDQMSVRDMEIGREGGVA